MINYEFFQIMIDEKQFIRFTSAVSNFMISNILFCRPVENDDAKRFGGLRAETELDVVLKTLYSIARQNRKISIICIVFVHCC